MPLAELEIPLANNDLGKGLVSILSGHGKSPAIRSIQMDFRASCLLAPHPHPPGTIKIYINSGSAVTEAIIRDDWCSVKHTLVTGFPGRECVDYHGALDKSVLTHGALERAEVEVPFYSHA